MPVGMTSALDALSRKRAWLIRNSLASGFSALPDPWASRLAPLLTLHEALGQRRLDGTVVYFGDSVVERISRDDRDRRDLAQFLEDHLGRPVLRLSYAAWHPLVWLGLARVLAVFDHRPAALVVPFNPRCLSPQWDWNPLWRFEFEGQTATSYIAADPLAVPAPPADEASPDDWRRFTESPVSWPEGGYRTVADVLDLLDQRPLEEAPRRRRQTELFRVHYLHPFDPAHPKLRAVAELVAVARALDIPVLCYVTPVNVQAADRLHGPTFGPRFAGQMAPILSALTQAAPDRLLDLSHDFSEEMFIHRDYTVEHLNQTGRNLLTQRLADAIQP